MTMFIHGELKDYTHSELKVYTHEDLFRYLINKKIISSSGISNTISIPPEINTRTNTILKPAIFKVPYRNEINELHFELLAPLVGGSISYPAPGQHDPYNPTDPYGAYVYCYDGVNNPVLISPKLGSNSVKIKFRRIGDIREVYVLVYVYPSENKYKLFKYSYIENPLNGIWSQIRLPSEFDGTINAPEIYDIYIESGNIIICGKANNGYAAIFQLVGAVWNKMWTTGEEIAGYNTVSAIVVFNGKLIVSAKPYGDSGMLPNQAFWYNSGTWVKALRIGSRFGGLNSTTGTLHVWSSDSRLYAALTDFYTDFYRYSEITLPTPPATGTMNIIYHHPSINNTTFNFSEFAGHLAITDINNHVMWSSNGTSWNISSMSWSPYGNSRLMENIEFKNYWYIGANYYRSADNRYYGILTRFSTLPPTGHTPRNYLVRTSGNSGGFARLCKDSNSYMFIGTIDTNPNDVIYQCQ